MLPPNLSILDRLKKNQKDNKTKYKIHQPASNSKNRKNIIDKEDNIDKFNPLNDEDFMYPYEKYTKEANEYKIENEGAREWHVRTHERVKRATSRSKDENRNTCSLYIQTDPLIWRHIREGVADVSYFHLITVLKKDSL